MRIAKLKNDYNLLLVLDFCYVNQPMGNHGMGIF